MEGCRACARNVWPAEAGGNEVRPESCASHVGVMTRPRSGEARRSLLLPALVVLSAWTNGVSAQGPGTTDAQVLTLTAGTRAAALAGAYTAIPDDPDGIFY